MSRLQSNFPSKRVMIIAGEVSGELYGALLSRAIKKKWPDTEILGIGGKRMKDEGAHLIASISGSFGITETFIHWKEIIKSYNKAKETLLRQKPDILVLIDYPEFNISLAKKAKSAGIPVLYYVSPQVWAWRAGRIKKIASLVNKIAVLFPFEVDVYKKTGLPCEFVGHPVAETIDIGQSKEELKARLGLDPSKGVITLLPGSRPSEIKRHMPVLKDVAGEIRREFPDMQIIMPLIYGTFPENDLPGHIKVVYDRTREAVACSEAAAVASGTATLEAALLAVPMAVFYKLSFLTFFFGRLLVKVKFISLVNLLSGRKVVAELIQKEASAEKIFLELKKILDSREYREKMISDLLKIREIMGEKTASVRVASMVGKLAGWNSTGD